MLIKLLAKNVPPTSRRCTLNRTYRERNSAVWCGTVQCTLHILLFTESLLRRMSRIPCFIMFYYEKWGYYTLSKTPEVGIRRIPAYARVRLYTPIGTNQKFGGPGQDLGGLCPPGPSLKPPLLGSLGERCKLPQRGLWRSPSRNRIWCILALNDGNKFEDFP